jgi:hypothetical protein
MKYIAKSNTWFKAGTEVILIDDYRLEGPNGLPASNCGYFSGIIIMDKTKYYKGLDGEIGKERTHAEICSFDEFDIVNEDL